MLGGRRQATDVRSVDAERSVDTREEGVKGGDGKGGEFDGREVVQEAVGSRTLDCNIEDAPIPTRKAGAQEIAQRRGCRYCPVQHEGSHQVHALLAAPSIDFTRGHHELNPVGLVREFGGLVPTRDRKRGPIALVGTVADATG